MSGRTTPPWSWFLVGSPVRGEGDRHAPGSHCGGLEKWVSDPAAQQSDVQPNDSGGAWRARMPLRESHHQQLARGRFEGWPPVTELDFQGFTRLLMDNLEDAYTALSQRHPEHQLYAFGPYTNGAFEYLVPTASSARGLAETVATYKQGKSYAATPVETLALQLKWSPCDSPLHEDVSFEDEVTAFIEHASDALRLAYEEEDHAACRELDESVHVAMCTALKTLDLRGVFGSGEERPLLNVWKGDQSDEERISFAEILNPAAVVRRFQAELVTISALG